MTVCPNCGNEAQDTAVFCDQCGTRLKEPEVVATAVAESAQPVEPEGVRCAACGYPNVPGELFCENCGVPLEALEPEPAVATEPAEAVPAAETVETPVEAPPAAEIAETLAEAPPAAETVETPVKTAPAEPAEAAEMPVAPEVAVEAPAPVGATCPACGASVGADDEFCDDCGAALKEAEAPAVEAEVVPAVAGPRLVVADTGAEIPLPAGDEVLIGREDPISGIFPDIDLTPHGGEEGGVSRKHVRIRAQDGRYTVEDLNSTNFTFVNRQRLAPGSPQPVKDGDELRLGRVRLVFKSQ